MANLCTFSRIAHLSLWISLALLALPARAEFVVVQPLSFGTIVVLSNNSVQSITIDPLGNRTMTTGLREIQTGHPAIFFEDDVNPNRQFFVTAQIGSATTNTPVTSNEQFVLSSLTVPSVIISSADRTAEIPVGGTMETSGSGSLNFADTTYTATLSITINF